MKKEILKAVLWNVAEDRKGAVEAGYLTPEGDLTILGQDTITDCTLSHEASYYQNVLDKMLEMLKDDSVTDDVFTYTVDRLLGIDKSDKVANKLALALSVGTKLCELLNIVTLIRKSGLNNTKEGQIVRNVVYRIFRD